MNEHETNEEQPSGDHVPEHEQGSATPPATVEATAEKPESVHKHAKACGHMHAMTIGEDRPHKPAHLIAEVLHGWLKYQNATGQAPEMSKSDYLAAIEAAAKGKVHGPADKRGA